MRPSGSTASTFHRRPPPGDRCRTSSGRRSSCARHPDRLVHHHQVRGEHRHVVAARSGDLGPAEHGVTRRLHPGRLGRRVTPPPFPALHRRRARRRRTDHHPEPDRGQAERASGTSRASPEPRPGRGPGDGIVPTSGAPDSPAARRTSARMRQASAQRAQRAPWSTSARICSKGSSPAAAAQYASAGGQSAVIDVGQRRAEASLENRPPLGHLSPPSRQARRSARPRYTRFSACFSVHPSAPGRPRRSGSPAGAARRRCGAFPGVRRRSRGSPSAPPARASPALPAAAARPGAAAGGIGESRR